MFIKVAWKSEFTNFILINSNKKCLFKFKFYFKKGSAKKSSCLKKHFISKYINIHTVLDYLLIG